MGGHVIGVAEITIAAADGTPWRILARAQLVWLLLFLIGPVIVRFTGTRIAASTTENRANPRHSPAGRHDKMY
jgi:hypothetical protein